MFFFIIVNILREEWQLCNVQSWRHSKPLVLSCRDLHLFIIVCGESLYTETGFGEHAWWLLIDCYITDILTTTTSTLVFFHYCCYPRGLAEHLRLYLKVSRRVEVYLLSAIFVSRLSMLFFPLKHSLYTTSFLLFTCTKLLVTVLCDVFFSSISMHILCRL